MVTGVLEYPGVFLNPYGYSGLFRLILDPDTERLSFNNIQPGEFGDRFPQRRFRRQMSHQDNRHHLVPSLSPLNDGRDRNILRPENGGYLGQYSGMIDRRNPEIVTAGHISDRDNFQGTVPNGNRGFVAGKYRLSRFDQVGHHRAGRRTFSSALSVK